MSREFVVPIVWETLRKEAEIVLNREPLMKTLIDEAILQHREFRDAITYRLATKLRGEILNTDQWIRIFQDAYKTNGVDLENAACLDLLAIRKRDPACDSLFTAFMFFKGYKALQVYRFSNALYTANRKDLAYLMQSRASEVFSVDIHPAAKIGIGLMIDHATGLVVGETAVIGDNCSFLHGVTLGGTGKHSGDRHPKLGNNVSVGCNASLVGNIAIGDNVKIGAGSVVLKGVPANNTAVGCPARIITNKAQESLVNKTLADGIDGVSEKVLSSLLTVATTALPTATTPTVVTTSPMNSASPSSSNSASTSPLPPHTSTTNSILTSHQDEPSSSTIPSKHQSCCNQSHNPVSCRTTSSTPASSPQHHPKQQQHQPQQQHHSKVPSCIAQYFSSKTFELHRYPPLVVILFMPVILLFTIITSGSA